MSDDQKLFGAHLDADLVDVASDRLEYGEKKDVLQQLAEAIAYGGRWDNRTPLDIQIERVETDLEEWRDKRRTADAEIERLESKLKDLRSRREEMRSAEEQLDAALTTIESDLRDGRRVHARLGVVQSVARDFDLKADEVIDRLRQRNPDVPDDAFVDPKDEDLQKQARRAFKDHRWEGLPRDQQRTPVEERENNTR